MSDEVDRDRPTETHSTPQENGLHTVHRIDGYKLLNFASHFDDNTIEQAKQTASMPFVHPHVAR